MTTLVSFLGKGQGNNGYRQANYYFEIEQETSPEKYFGLALAEKIQPNKIILLGTSGSMWDVFLEQGSDGLEEEWLRLSDAVQNQQVSRDMLVPFEAYLTKKLNTQVHCVLIPFAKNTKEQIEILSVISEQLQNDEKVVMDVTHGFRHLPMLALVAARFLKRIKNIDVQHIYYGALEMTENEHTPVLMLDGMLSMLDWVDALTTFDKDGDYGEFADLLIKEGLPENNANLLKQAAYFERTTNSSKAREKLNTIFNTLEDFNSDLFNLFKPQLKKRLQWYKQKTRGLREQELAKEYLKRQDYLRAVVYAMEGVISHALNQDKQDENNHDLRKEKSDELAKNSVSFKKLRPIRNTLAHGNRSNKETNSVTADEQRLRSSLKDRFENLF